MTRDCRPLAFLFASDKLLNRYRQRAYAAGLEPGDLLAASSIPSHAMRAGGAPPMGTVIGKALGNQTEGTGVIQVLVVLQ